MEMKFRGARFFRARTGVVKGLVRLNTVGIEFFKKRFGCLQPLIGALIAQAARCNASRTAVTAVKLLKIDRPSDVTTI